jgi:hypothetical protein
VVLAESELKGKQIAARDYKSLFASTINQSVHSEKAFNKGRVSLYQRKWEIILYEQVDCQQ